MTLRLLDVHSSPFSSRCRMLIYAKTPSQVEIIPPPGGIFSDEYKAFHPFVKIPTLDLGTGEMLVESDVICEYLDDVLDGPTLKPKTPLALAHARLLARVADLYVMAPMMPLFKQIDPATRDAEIVSRETAAIMIGYDKLEYFLNEGSHAVGNTLSLADCTLVPTLLLTLEYLPRLGIERPLSHRPKTEAYWKRINEDPIAARVIKEMLEQLAKYRAKQTA